MQLSLMDLLQDGNKLAEAGLSLAVDHAEGVDPEFKAKAWKLFLEWLSFQKHRSVFKMEDYINWLKLNDKMRMPPINQAFGFLPKKAAKEELIKKVGFMESTKPQSHCRPCTLWMVIG